MIKITHLSLTMSSSSSSALYCSSMTALRACPPLTILGSLERLQHQLPIRQPRITPPPCSSRWKRGLPLHMQSQGIRIFCWTRALFQYLRSRNYGYFVNTAQPTDWSSRRSARTALAPYSSATGSRITVLHRPDRPNECPRVVAAVGQAAIEGECWFSKTNSLISSRYGFRNNKYRPMTN